MHKLLVPEGAGELVGPGGQPLVSIPGGGQVTVTLPNGRTVPAPRTNAERKEVQAQIDFFRAPVSRAEMETTVAPSILNEVDGRLDKVVRFLVDHFDLVPRTEEGQKFLAELRNPQGQTLPKPAPWWDARVWLAKVRQLMKKQGVS